MTVTCRPSRSKVATRVLCHRLGVVEYSEAMTLQGAAHLEAVEGGLESILLLQHEPVFTRGRRTLDEHLLLRSLQDYHALGATILETDRGGGITFHGPGQLVCYPVLHLCRHGLTPRSYIHALEQVLIRTAEALGCRAHGSDLNPGAWVAGTKLGAVGVRVRNGVTTHGCSLNVRNLNAWFGAIVPCGLQGTGVTSLEQELGAAPAMNLVEDVVMDVLAELFHLHLEPREALSLE
jgi:lipoyl(octanoyl) transferase